MVCLGSEEASSALAQDPLSLLGLRVRIWVDGHGDEIRDARYASRDNSKNIWTANLELRSKLDLYG